MKDVSDILVKDIMGKEVISVGPETPLAEASKLMLQNGFSGLPVVDSARKVVGIITEYDLITKGSALHLPTLVKLFGEYIPASEEFSFTVKDVMNPEPLIIQEDAPIAEIIKAFSEHHRVNPIPIVNNQSILTGIVSRYDIIQFYSSLLKESQ